MSIYLKNILRALLILSIQVLILNKVSLRWWGGDMGGAPPFTPYLYPIILLLLPVRTSTSLMLLVGFFVGLIIDMFMNTGGMHAMACLVVAYARRPIISMFLPTTIEEVGMETPSTGLISWSGFLIYSATILLIHHVLYFCLEIWAFSNIGYILLKVLSTFLTSILFVMVYMTLFGGRRASRA